MVDTAEEASENYEKIHGGSYSIGVGKAFKCGAKWQQERIDRDIEEAAANLADPNICKTANWIAGASYQAERMYSEEEVFSIIDKAFHMYASSHRHDAKEWFEQFKKK